MVYIPHVIIIMILWFMEGNFKHIEIVCRSGKFLLYNSSSQKLVLATVNSVTHDYAKYMALINFVSSEILTKVLSIIKVS